MKYFSPILLSVLLFCTGFVHGQLIISNPGTNYTVSFDATLADVNNGQYQGSGLAPSPAPGQLDGDAWEIIGLSPPNGKHSFGQTHTAGDFARGSSNGGVTTGGLYAFQIAPGDYAFGFQPAGNDLTPGEFILKVRNSTGSPVAQLSVSYEWWVYNDQNRGNQVEFSWSYDTTHWNTVSGTLYVSPGPASGSPSWTLGSNPSFDLGVAIPNGSDIYLRWTTDDNNGSGSRDEFALDDVQIQAQVQSNPLVISEIMANPEIDGSGAPLSEPDAEWFEIFNNTPYDINLNGLILEDNAATHVISGAPLINSGDYYVMGRADGSLNGPYTHDYIYSGLALGNSGDILKIKYPDGARIDSVDFSSWTVPVGASLVYGASAAADHNLETNWFTATVRELTYTGNNPSADKGSPGTGGTGQILPLWIVDIDGQFTGNRVELSWLLETPEGIEYFEVESSTDGFHFRPRLKVSAQAEQLRYSVQFDEYEANPLFIRIRQADFSGASFYSDILLLEKKEQSQVRVFPNPARDQIFIQSNPDQSWKQMEIFDASGTLRMQLTGTRNAIDVSVLPAGLYFIRFTKATGGINIPFIKK